MNDLAERLYQLTLKQQEQINELRRENRSLETLTHTLGNRIYELEDKQRVIDSAIADVPIGQVSKLDDIKK